MSEHPALDPCHHRRLRQLCHHRRQNRRRRSHFVGICHVILRFSTTFVCLVHIAASSAAATSASP